MSPTVSECSELTSVSLSSAWRVHENKVASIAVGNVCGWQLEMHIYCAPLVTLVSYFDHLGTNGVVSLVPYGYQSYSPCHLDTRIVV